MLENPLSIFARDKNSSARTSTAPGQPSQRATSGHTAPLHQASPWLDELLADPITARLVGKNFDVLAAKWRKCFAYLGSPDQLHWYTLPFAKRGFAGNWQNMKSFIWPAIFGPYWFAYRKMYLAAAGFLLLNFIASLSPLYLGAAAMFLSLWFAPAIYLCHIRDSITEIKRLPPSEADAYVSRRGSTSWLSVAAFVLVCIMFGLAITELDSRSNLFELNSIAQCNSSEVTDLILNKTFYEPKRQALARPDYSTISRSGGDVNLITVGIDTIRQLQYDDRNHVRLCAANYNVRVDPALMNRGQLQSVPPTLVAGMLLSNWIPYGAKFQICAGTIVYRIERELSTGQMLVTWRCGD